ncbi:MAG: hypothetical protein OHK0019_09090 [Saprospiraceae bacterium]
MIKHLLFLFAAISFFATSCEEKKPKPTVSPLVSVNMVEKKSRKCVSDSVCAEISLRYPILTGGDNTSAVNAINDSLQKMALAGILANPSLIIEQAFDSAQTNLFALLQEQVKQMPNWGTGFFKSVETKTLLNTSKFLSFEMNASGFEGGAHPYYFAALTSYDLNSGKSVGLTDVVRDTSALRPMLEKGFLEAKKQTPADDTLKLSDLLFPEIGRLPISTNFCLVPEGVRFLYNPYEVASWAVGPTDITLTWEQLGSLADRNKWLD